MLRLNLTWTSSCCRCISTSVVRSVENTGTGKKRKPWDKRFPINAKDIGPRREGGSREMLKALPERLVAPTGIVDKQTQRFIRVKEMVPEFIVPDLTNFELKAYVTYTSKEIKQNKLTPKEIFNSVYADQVEAAFKSGKIKVKDDSVHLEDGSIFDLESGQRVTSS